MSRVDPQRLEIEPTGPLDLEVRAPGSKSISNRALLCAALAEGPSELRGGLHSDDTEAMIAALRSLGVSVAATPGGTWRVEGCGGRLAAPARPIDARGSGTTARFLCAAAPLAAGPVRIDGNARMRERPIADLLEALRNLGVDVEEHGQKGCPPVEIRGRDLPGGRVEIDARRSSQFVSALLLAAPCATGDLELALRGPVTSRPYIDLSLEVMRAFGAEAAWRGETTLWVRATGYRGAAFGVEPDATAASYPFAAAAIAGGEVRVPEIPLHSAQGDFAFLELLARMGCGVERSATGVRVTRRGPLRGIDADLNAVPDTVMTLAVVALFAEGATRIRNVANLRIKESDRLGALEAELRKLGAQVATGEDWIEIAPGEPRGAEIETYDDHRIAMAFALAGLRIPGVVILEPGCVAKTWPDYFEEMGCFGAPPPKGGAGPS